MRDRDLEPALAVRKRAAIMAKTCPALEVLQGPETAEAQAEGATGTERLWPAWHRPSPLMALAIGGRIAQACCIGCVVQVTPLKPIQPVSGP